MRDCTLFLSGFYGKAKRISSYSRCDGVTSDNLGGTESPAKIQKIIVKDEDQFHVFLVTQRRKRR